MGIWYKLFVLACVAFNISVSVLSPPSTNGFDAPVAVVVVVVAGESWLHFVGGKL